MVLDFADRVEMNVWHPRKEFFQRNRHLKPSQVRTQAPVGPGPECEMPYGLPFEVSFQRVIERCLIPAR